MAKQLSTRTVFSVQRFAELVFKASEVQKHDLKGHTSDGGSIKLLLTIRGKSDLVTDERRENQMSPSPVTLLSLGHATKVAFSTDLPAVFTFNRNLTLDSLVSMLEGMQSQRAELCPTLSLESASISGGRKNS